MIKYVLQYIPSHIMSIYLLPNSVIDDIEKMINAFWWGGRSNNCRIKWMACPKEFGGMGFRNFKAFTVAMVAKQGWSFLSKPESLVARVFKSRYFPRSSFWVLNSVITRALLGGVFGIHVSYFYMEVGGQLEMGSRSV